MATFVGRGGASEEDDRRKRSRGASPGDPSGRLNETTHPDDRVVQRTRQRGGGCRTPGHRGWLSSRCSVPPARASGERGCSGGGRAEPDRSRNWRAEGASFGGPFGAWLFHVEHSGASLTRRCSAPVQSTRRGADRTRAGSLGGRGAQTIGPPVPKPIVTAEVEFRRRDIDGSVRSSTRRYRSAAYG